MFFSSHFQIDVTHHRFGSFVSIICIAICALFLTLCIFCCFVLFFFIIKSCTILENIVFEKVRFAIDRFGILFFSLAIFNLLLCSFNISNTYIHHSVNGIHYYSDFRFDFNQMKFSYCLHNIVVDR